MPSWAKEAILAPVPQIGFLTGGGIPLNNASASNWLDRKEGNWRQPHFRLSQVVRFSHVTVAQGFIFQGETVSDYEEGCARGAKFPPRTSAMSKLTRDAGR